MERKWLSDSIQIFLKNACQSRSDLCSAIGIADRTLYSYETGERTPRVVRAKVIGKILKIDWRLFYGE